MATIEALRDAIHAFEEEFGCHTAFHGYTGEVHRVVHFLAKIHTNPYCSILKEKRYDTVNPLCRSFDSYRADWTLMSRRDGFFKYCHAGVLEYMAPVLVRGRLAGVLFVGPFRCQRSDLPEDTVVSSRMCSDLAPFDEQKNRLAHLAPERAERLRKMVFLLTTTIGQVVEAGTEGGLPGNRRDRINHFFQNRFRMNVGLVDLAEYLGLSASRTTQVLREEFGRGFPELLAEQRVDYAKRLLANSCFTATTIAEQAGFADACYFFRVFKKSTGMSPGEFRRINAPEIP